MAKNVTSDSATIVWETNEPATSQIIYGTTTAYGQSKKSDSYITSHSIKLTNLAPYTRYYFKVISKDTAGNISAAEHNYNFRTLEEGITKDTNPPTTISIISPEDEATISGVTVIQAYAEDNVGIAKYELFINDERKAVQITSTNIYQYELDTLPYGNNVKLTLKVAAYDAEGGTISTSIRVTVNNEGSWPISCKDNCKLDPLELALGAKVFIVNAEEGKDPLTLEPLISITIDGERNRPSDFIIWNVRPGNYYVCAYKDLDGDGVMTRGVDATGIYKEGGKPAIVTVTPYGGYLLKGHFNLSIEKFSISGIAKRLEAVAVDPVPHSGVSIELRANPGIFVTSGDDGSFKIETPTIEPLKIKETPAKGYHSLKATLKGYLTGNSESIYVTRNISNFNLVILSTTTAPLWGHTNPEKGFVYGVVKDKAGNKLEGARVIIHPSRGEKIGYIRAGKIDYTATATCPKGVFTIKDVEPLSYEYVIYATHPNPMYSFTKKNIFIHKNQLTYVEFQSQ